MMTKKNNQIGLIKKWLENYKHYKKMIRTYQQMLRQDVTIKGVNYDKQKTQLLSIRKKRLDLFRIED